MDPLWGLIQEETMAVRPRRSADWQSAVSRIGNPLTVAVRHDSKLFQTNHLQQALFERRIFQTESPGQVRLLTSAATLSTALPARRVGGNTSNL